MDISIINGTAVLETGTADTSIAIRDGKFADNAPVGVQILNAQGCWVLPGFVDIHVHGGGGYDFMDLTEEAFRTVVNTHAFHGTTAIAPTTLSAPLAELEAFCQLYRTVSDLDATLLGVHLEGPFLAPSQKGAQNEDCIVPPTRENFLRLAQFRDIIARIDLAPEVPGALDCADHFSQMGAVVSAGHSDALYPDMEKAFARGVRHVTHLFCASPWARKINERVQAGIPEAAYLMEDMAFELIGDGLHIAPQTIEMAAKFKRPGKVMLVTDAMRAAGTDVTESWLGAIRPENRVIVEGGVAKLPDRSSFAGSIATMDRVFQNVCRNTRLPITKIAELMSLAPARLLGWGHRKGSIAPGKDGDLVIVDKQTAALKAVISQGRIIRNEL